MIDEKMLIKEIKMLMNSDALEGHSPAAVLYEVYDRIMEMSKTGGWIPFTVDKDGILDCPLPDVEEEILVSDGEFVWMDTFISDGEVYYLDSNEELIGCAWQPLPEPYKERR